MAKRTWIHFIPRGYPATYHWVVRGILKRRVKGGGAEVVNPDDGKEYYAPRDRIFKVETEGK